MDDEQHRYKRGRLSRNALVCMDIVKASCVVGKLYGTVEGSLSHGFGS